MSLSQYIRKAYRYVEVRVVGLFMSINALVLAAKRRNSKFNEYREEIKIIVLDSVKEEIKEPAPKT